ncbi:hypothetical protein C1646_670056 [Rhizophagus diaphanus]|nr:hypothetical protein C1646_670056 [Rhizophagus diaphanus] [Rhizophagus sp. MUCL 43196]
MAVLCNKQVSVTKTAIGLLMVGSGTSKIGINTLANMEMSSMYQTVYNMLKKMQMIINLVFAHILTVILPEIQTYLNNYVIPIFVDFPATSIDELTQSYNNRLHMDEDINNKFDIKNEKQSEDCEFDNAETNKTIDIELSEKILGIFYKIAFAENRIQIPPMQQPLYDISNCYQQSGSLHNVKKNLLARFVSTEIDNTQSTLEFFF